MIELDALKPLITSKEQLLDFLRSCELLDDVDPSIFEKIIEKGEVIKELSGNLLSDYKDKINDVYFLVYGRLRLFTASREKIIEFVPSSSIGEIDILTHAAKAVRIEIIRDSVLIKISSQNFLDLLKTSPKLLENTCHIIATKLHQHFGPNVKPGQFAMSIACITMSDQIDGLQFVQNLELALSKIGHTLLVTRKQAEDNHFDNEEKFYQFLAEVERKYKWIIYLCDPQINRWTKFCLRQVDKIFALLSCKQETELTQEEKYVLYNDKILATKDLIFVHTTHHEITKTARFLEVRSHFAYHHMEMGNIKDMDRLARVITNRSLGIVLSGGGARGVAHIGVLQALLEENIEIDFIGGVSIGSIIAGAYAHGYSFDQMFHFAEKLFSKTRKLFDPTFPLYSFIAGRKMSKKLQNYFPKNIEDLKTRFFCASTSLYEKKLFIHRKGALHRAVRASTSLPGIFPPVYLDKKILVDGGILNVLPIDVMADTYNVHRIIAIDVSNKEHDLYQALSTEKELSFTQSIKSLFSSKQAHFPIFHILSHAYDYFSQENKTHLLNRGLAQIYIRPPVEKYASLNFANLEKIRQIGYDHAKNHLKEYKALITAHDN